MTRFLAKRGILIAVMLFGLLTLTFFISHIAPGDPARLRAGPDATHEMVEVIRVKYGLDQPLTTQFYVYLKGMLVGDWGRVDPLVARSVGRAGHLLSEHVRAGDIFHPHLHRARRPHRHGGGKSIRIPPSITSCA